MQDGTAQRRGIGRRLPWLAAALGVLALWAGTPSKAAAADSEVTCLAQAIYWEARGEPESGQRAVGHVVMNRTRAAQFPRGVCGVVHQRIAGRCQFTFSCDGRKDTPGYNAQWAESLALAQAIYAGRSADPTHGALWFQSAAVRFGGDVRRTVRIGQHAFYAPRTLPKSQEAELR
jgi:spore germination cell wall hydrolase CwlJ-like protein